MALNVLIVDDEFWSREAIRLRMAGDPRFDVIGEADNGDDALLLMQSLSPDVVFLDVEMPSLSGIQVAMEAKAWFKGAIVFVTAFSKYAVSAFDADAFHYIVKPINDDKFQQLLDKICHLHEVGQATAFTLNQLKGLKEQNSVDKPLPRTEYLHRLSLKDGQNVQIVDVSDIFHIESAGNYLGVTTEQGTLIQRMTMKQLQDLLNPKTFLRCHRSHIINRDFIETMQSIEGRTYIKTIDGKEHEVSRRYLKAVKQFLRA